MEYQEGEAGKEIERVVRITRDALAGPGTTNTVRVMIVGVALLAENRTGAQAEISDTAQIFTLDDGGSAQLYVLDLQLPERDVAEAQLEMIRSAQASGETISLFVDAKTGKITGVQTGGPAAASEGADQQTVDGFVESIAHAPTGGLSGMAVVEFTTAPPFTSPGQVVALESFVPALMRFLVVLGSPEYELFLTGLRKKLRMRIFAATPRQPGPNDGPSDVPGTTPSGQPKEPVINVRCNVGAATNVTTKGSPALVRGAQLLHALASASRPVWIQVSRKSLDVGPDAKCTEGLPSSDLTPQTLRDLRIPYKAEWIGWGCFNHGVYRFQFGLKTPFEIYVDGKPLCVHASADGATKFAHACLDCEHEVRVILCNWTCDQDFAMDVYRIR